MDDMGEAIDQKSPAWALVTILHALVQLGLKKPKQQADWFSVVIKRNPLATEEAKKRGITSQEWILCRAELIYQWSIANNRLTDF